LVNYEGQEEEWKLKAEIGWLAGVISTYLSKFDSSNLQNFIFEDSTVKADVIWAIK